MTSVAINHPLSQAVALLLEVSDYAVRQSKLLNTLLAEDDCSKPLTAQEYQAILEAIPIDKPLQAYAQALRVCRHRHFLRLLLREFAQYADTVETMTAWSDFADAVIIQTMRYCERQVSARFGVPSNGSQLYVLAMGKLGGRELNFSSDIDLIFAFSAAGDTLGLESISHQEYYHKVVQQFIFLLQSKTVEGFVFRVDLRLRPNGDSGALVSSLFALETYYQEQGRDWERYAMVKARLLNTSADTSWFARLIQPFVYRRYIDFGVIESLRVMKAMIEREIQANPLLDDIKRGRGGIREIEFIIQCFQLIRGGRLPYLQQSNALLALRALKKEKVFDSIKGLRCAYLFFRKLENILQAQNDQQTHVLPSDGRQRQQVTRAMGYMLWDDLQHALEHHQQVVSRAFHKTLYQADSSEEAKRLLTSQLTSVWQGQVEELMAVNVLASFGFQNPKRCYELICGFRQSPRCRHLSQAARSRLDCFMVLLLMQLMSIEACDTVLFSLLHLLDNIVGRSAYLVLLIENPFVLKELLYWFENSRFITDLLISQPFLLEILLDKAPSWKPLSRAQLNKLLQKRLLHCKEPEEQNERLRQFKLSAWLYAARAEFLKQCDSVRIGRFLSDVAEVIIVQVVEFAYQQLQVRIPDVMRIQSRFTVVAYGKLGSREMNYDSDVDLVFLHEVKPIDERLVTRLTQKIIHMLTMRSQTGLLYQVDTRLRPSGEAGLLVSSVDAFMMYQSTQAWVWEHQALLKARVLSGVSRTKHRLYQLKQQVLWLPREKCWLSQEIQQMRAKISKYATDASIKHVPGGLLDLEFLVQFLVLAYPQQSLARETNTLKQLSQLRADKRLTQEQFLALQHAYRQYHQVLHQHLLHSKYLDTSDNHLLEVISISEVLYSLTVTCQGTSSRVQQANSN